MRRREFIAQGSALSVALEAEARQAEPRYTGRPALRIADVQAFPIGAMNHNWVFVKITTDQGIYGWGQCYSVGPDLAVAEVVRDFKSWLLGKDPRNVEYLWATMYQFTRFPGGSVINAAISGIEHALWDIAGKAAGLPVYMLLGGKCRNKVRVYQSTGGGTPAQLAANAKQLIAERGYNAIKMAPYPPGSQAMSYNAVTRAAGERAAAVREAVGPDIDLLFDAHATIFEPVRAFQMAEALKPAMPLFLEEPLRMENVDALSALKHKVEIPIATGECLYTKFEFREVLERQAADIIQPDICLVGGFLEMKKIAAMAEAHYVTVAPHWGGTMANMINCHFGACTPNLLIVEYVPDHTGPYKDLIRDMIAAKDGYLEIPEKPGWGYEMNEEAFRHYPPKPWHRGFAFRADGTPDYI
ncbi:MAG: mandelate racemase/muconate lactonizing enzyme family protein [Bryobacterales bacterium]|nr:mandelate racemase/muconate lactonizing enzyme family protein [Bryobacterales bacterium]